jgi:penicillin amidase
MSKIKKLFTLGLPAAVAGGAGYVAARLFASRPLTGGDLRMECLDEPVEVVFDHAGIPHITARNDADGYRALGFIMAQDRIVQMEIMRKVSQGTLSQSLGNMAVETDRFMRTVGIHRTAEAFVGNLDTDSANVMDHFCEGLNSYLAQPSMRLPFEFLFLGKPRPWMPSDCLSLGLFVTWLLDSFWPADLTREKLFRALGQERAMDLLPETADYNEPPVKVDGPGHRAETLDVIEDVDWDFENYGVGGHWIHGGIPTSVFGSNNWVLSGSRTRTGKVILAGDPHVQHNAPGFLYMFHLKIPSLDAVGAGFPGLPLVAFGHNGYCGWTGTSLCPDTQDLYVETFENEESDRYLYDGEWVEPKVLHEQIKVRFSKPRTLKIMVTKHGPVINRKGNKGLALKWLSHDPTLDSLSAMFKQNRARSFEEFTSVMENFMGPALNQAYGDVDGNIGYLAAAKLPKRKKGDGTIPYDGSDPGCEWEGYVDAAAMPMVKNPEEGFIATANSKIVSDGFGELVTKAWEQPYRCGRIAELIRSRAKWGVEDMRDIHQDCFTHPGSTYADAVVKAAAEAGELTERVAEAVEHLRDWDRQARADSVATCIYFYGWEKLREMLLRHRLGADLYEDYIYGWTTPNLAIENIVQSENPYWLPGGYDSFGQLVLESVYEAVIQLESVFSTPDMSEWKWGRVHHLTCQSLLGLFWPLTKIFNVGPVPRDGEGDTVNAGTPESDCLTQLLGRGTMGFSEDLGILPARDSNAAYAGPVMRMLIDFADLDNSRVVLDVGQSGHRLSPHYKDHFSKWLAVDYFPLPYSDRKVYEQAEGILIIKP